jgi:hypothetical protein
MSGTLVLVVLTASVPAQPVPAPALPPEGELILRCNEAALAAIRAARTPPPTAARHLAMVHVAMYDAVTAVRPTHRPFRVAAALQGPTSAEAAAAVAAHRVLLELYPALVQACDAALDECLADVPDGPAKDAGMRLGQSVAEQVLRWRAYDGASRPILYAPPPAPGVWRPTPPRFLPPLLPQWRYVTPFAVARVIDFLPPPPPRIDSQEFALHLAEVRALGAAYSPVRTPDQTVIAWFWDDGEGTVTPPGHWNRIAQAAARQRGLSLEDAARLFAQLNVSLADAAVLCWEAKFRYGYWRPVTAIQEAAPGQADPTWMPLLNTPAFPSYTSGHSTFSGAGAAALAAFFGTDAVPFRIGSDGLPGRVRDYPGFWAAALEAGRSRIYGGIHYEFDNREGLACGKNLAEAIARVHFVPAVPAMPPAEPLTRTLSRRR